MNLLKNVANSVESCHRCHCKSVANVHDRFCQQTDASMERRNKIMSIYMLLHDFAQDCAIDLSGLAAL